MCQLQIRPPVTIVTGGLFTRPPTGLTGARPVLNCKANSSQAIPSAYRIGNAVGTFAARNRCFILAWDLFQNAQEATCLILMRRGDWP